jgi:hypothetical protein
VAVVAAGRERSSMWRGVARGGSQQGKQQGEGGNGKQGGKRHQPQQQQPSSSSRRAHLQQRVAAPLLHPQLCAGQGPLQAGPLLTTGDEPVLIPNL